MSRHPSVEAIMEFFDFDADRLPPGLIRQTSNNCTSLAVTMAKTLSDDPELTEGLRKLLEAKDCFVRAAVRQERARG